MFFECHRLFALLFDIEENGNVGSSNGEGFGCFESFQKHKSESEAVDVNVLVFTIDGDCCLCFYIC